MGSRESIRLAGNVFGKLQLNRAGSFVRRQAECLANHGRNTYPAHDFPGAFGQWFHRSDDVNYLKARLTRRQDRLLTGDQDHWHCAEVSVGRAGDQIQRTRPECRQTNARLSSKTAVSRGHEGSGLFMPGQKSWMLERRSDSTTSRFSSPRKAPFTYRIAASDNRGVTVAVVVLCQTLPLAFSFA
jgi:hypothetical protein